MTQQLDSFFKLPLALTECLLFAAYRNVFLCIAVHMSYNILVYGHNIARYQNRFRR